MRKIVCFILAMILCVPVCAFAEDYSSLTVEELYTMIDQAKAELLKRELVEAEKAVIVDADGISLILTGERELTASYDGTMKLTLDVMVVNSSDKNVGVSIDEIYINGWEESALASFSLAAGKKAKEKIEMYHVDVDADLKAIEELETIEFHCHTYDADSYHSLTKGIVITVQF